MSSPLLLAASGGLGREVLAAARAGGDWDPIGFLDDDPTSWGGSVGGLPVMGGLEAVVAHPQAAVVLCAGKGAARLAIAERLAGLGVTEDRLASVVHPSVSIGVGCRVGPGSVLLAGVVMTADVTVGRAVVCMPSVVLTHDDVVQDGATLCAGVVLGGSVRVGRGAYLGMASSVREGITVGPDTVVGMGAVVLRDVPRGEWVCGVPARSMTGDALVAGEQEAERTS